MGYLLMKWIDVIRYANKGNPSPPRRVEKSAAEWRALLPADVFRITREHGTERAHSSEMCSLFEPGVYDCACCATPLFDATHKFESGTGWPSFTEPIDGTHVAAVVLAKAPAPQKPTDRLPSSPRCGVVRPPSNCRSSGSLHQPRDRTLR